MENKFLKNVDAALLLKSLGYVILAPIYYFQGELWKNSRKVHNFLMQDLAKPYSMRYFCSGFLNKRGGVFYKKLIISNLSLWDNVFYPIGRELFCVDLIFVAVPFNRNQEFLSGDKIK